MPESTVNCPSGLYRIDAGQREEILRDGALRVGSPVVVLEGSRIESREAFFDSIAGALDFPDYFGRNWDAVYDCLTDPGLFPSDGVVLLLDGCERFARREPEQWRIALKVFHDACDFWAPLERPLYVLLQVPEDLAPGTPHLPPNCPAAGPEQEANPRPGG